MTIKLNQCLSETTEPLSQDLDFTYQALIHQSFHSRSSCPHENLAPPWEPQRSWRSLMVVTSVHCGCPGKLWWPSWAARHIYLSVDPWCEQHRSVGARSDEQKGLLGRAHHSHSPGHWQCPDGTLTLMRQDLEQLADTPPSPHPVTSNSCWTGWSLLSTFVTGRRRWMTCNTHNKTWQKRNDVIFPREQHMEHGGVFLRSCPHVNLMKSCKKRKTQQDVFTLSFFNKKLKACKYPSKTITTNYDIQK